MSVLEELRVVEERIVARLGELRPVVEEYEELRRVAGRLGIDVDALCQGIGTAGAAQSIEKAAAPVSGGTRAKGAERRQQILALIGERPGITVPDVSERLGLEPPPVYRVIRKLQADAIVIKEGKHLRLA